MLYGVLEGVWGRDYDFRHHRQFGGQGPRSSCCFVCLGDEAVGASGMAVVQIAAASPSEGANQVEACEMPISFLPTVFPLLALRPTTLRRRGSRRVSRARLDADVPGLRHQGPVQFAVGVAAPGPGQPCQAVHVALGAEPVLDRRQPAVAGLLGPPQDCPVPERLLTRGLAVSLVRAGVQHHRVVLLGLWTKVEDRQALVCFSHGCESDGW